ncbi:cAMP-regulated phosphoprotein 21 [Osmerus eperlanus]|uniref:cAMP-regulated phosphoprotein 21 n=1 Tax=Osmerus eperlanus TaxID=29151 RepID=UPI002E10C4FB
MSEVNLGNLEVLQESSLLKSCDQALPCCPSPLPCAPSCCIETEGEGSDHDNGKQEQQKQAGNKGQPKRKPKAKGRLVRSMAVWEESSPSDAMQESQGSSDMNILSGYHDDEDVSCRGDEQEKDKESKRPPLSKESSLEYRDSTGIDLDQFITDTLNSNPRDKMMLLKLEQDMIDYITSKNPFKKFPHMSSYHRMLVHRVAAYFGMEHNVDQTGKAVIINKTGNTRIPEQRFIEMVQEEKGEEIQWRVILKRDNSSEDQARLHPLHDERRSKSMEEREEEYQRARDRIFNQEPVCTQEDVHTETRVVEELNPYSETQRRRQLFRGSRDGSGSGWTGSSRQSSTEADCRYSNDPRPWSSTDSDSSYQWPSPAPNHRSVISHSRDNRGSISLYRLPSSHPRPSSPLIPEEQVPSNNSTFILENGIPPGSILMNPQTGQPFLNPDGTPAVYNPPDNQQPTRSQTQLSGPPPPQQQPMATHAIPQVVQYSSYPPPQQMLPVSPLQHYSGAEELTPQFGHMTLSCQSSGDAPPLYPPPQSYVYAAPPPSVPANPPSYCQPPPPLPVYYYSGQYPASGPQPCRPVTPSQHSQATQQTGYTPVLSNQQQGYQGMMGVKPSQSQLQSMLGTYPPISAHPYGVVQGGVAVSYPQGGVVSGVGGDGGFCCMVSTPCAPQAMAPPLSGHPVSCANLSSQCWPSKY